MMSYLGLFYKKYSRKNRVLVCVHRGEAPDDTHTVVSIVKEEALISSN